MWSCHAFLAFILNWVLYLPHKSLALSPKIWRLYEHFSVSKVVVRKCWTKDMVIEVHSNPYPVMYLRTWHWASHYTPLHCCEDTVGRGNTAGRGKKPLGIVVWSSWEDGIKINIGKPVAKFPKSQTAVLSSCKALMLLPGQALFSR